MHSHSQSPRQAASGSVRGKCGGQRRPWACRTGAGGSPGPCAAAGPAALRRLPSAPKTPVQLLLLTPYSAPVKGEETEAGDDEVKQVGGSRF